MQGDSSSSGQPQSGQAQQQGESGQRRDSAEGPREGEQEGQQPGEQPGEQPGQQEPQQQDQPGEGQPRGDQADRPGGQKDQGDAPADGETGAGTRSGNDVEIWGNLPIHLRDIYRAEGREDLPAQYRDWIDSYYRRLNDSGRD